MADLYPTWQAVITHSAIWFVQGNTGEKLKKKWQPYRDHN